MKIDSKEMTELRAAQAAPRLDIYVGIHKALRACMADALLATGRMDPGDENDVARVSQRVLALLDFCAAHLQHENDFIHTAIEARAPGGLQQLAGLPARQVHRDRPAIWRNGAAYRPHDAGAQGGIA